MTQPTPEEKYGTHLKYEQNSEGVSRMNVQQRKL
jgi:hypothetical protein